MKKLKEMSVSELQLRHKELKEQANVINDKIEAESRCMSKDEEKEWDTIMSEADSIKRELKIRSMSEDEEVRNSALYARATAPTIYENTKERQAAGAAFRRMVSDGHGSVKIELRETISATGTTEVGDAIPVLIQDFVEPLEKGLILNQLGITMKTGLKANVSYPIMPSFEANFVDEKETVSETLIASSALKPKPHEITIAVRMTNLANLQTDGKVYAWVIENLALAVARSINRWVMQPSAIVTGIHGAMSYDKTANPIQTMQFAAAVPTYAELVAMRGKVQKTGAYNDGTYAYTMSGELAATLEATRRFDSGDTSIIVDGKIGGVPVLLSEFIEATGKDSSGKITFNASPKHVGFGRWSDLIIGQFGSMTLTVDPYTNAKAGAVNLVLDTFYSVDLLRPESFVIGTVKTTT